VHFDGIHSVDGGIGECHDPTLSGPRQKHESECCENHLATTVIEWRDARPAVYGRPPLRHGDPKRRSTLSYVRRRAHGASAPRDKARHFDRPAA
jgi:hypothetical protein